MGSTPFNHNRLPILHVRSCTTSEHSIFIHAHLVLHGPHGIDALDVGCLFMYCERVGGPSSRERAQRAEITAGRRVVARPLLDT